ncbi:MAG: EpsD family peptidyl-prolyl cis-trans isomerase [Gammaproteobacteria bacterium]|nr:EpsD family peptidyl-prolyl cis-trans isomerase [Gammaproteobacteria bacterium]
MKLSVLLAALIFALAGCNEKTGAEASPAQLAARVNGEEINTRSVEAVLTKAGVKNPAQDAANQVLNALLEQRLFQQQAKKEGLDKDANVQEALQAAERQVLAQAYSDKVTANAAKPGDSEIAEYYDKHPELFAERRIYRLQEIMIQVGPDTVGAVKSRMGSGANLGDLVQWLKSQNIPARGIQSVKSAEQLPLELVVKLHPLKDGQAITLENPKQITILAITGSQSQPLAREQARPAIERFLLTMRKRDLAKAELDKLRAAAKVEYVAPYAEAKAAAKDVGHAASAPKEEPAEQGLLDKALSGLK